MPNEFSEIFTLCPHTRQYIATGIEADMLTLTRVPEFRSRVNCPHCGAVHEWSRTEAWVRDAEGSMRHWPRGEP